MTKKIMISIITIIVGLGSIASAGLIYREKQENTSKFFTHLANQKPAVTNKLQTNQSDTDQSNKEPNISWEDLIPDIKTELNRNAPDNFPIIGPRFGIVVEEDINGDGISEAFIDIGTGGAYTNSITVMAIENNKPKLAQFKDKDGKITPLLFGEGISGAHGISFGTIPEKQTIYKGQWELKDVGSKLDCNVSAYKWNSDTRAFEFNESLSNDVQQNFCAEIKSKIPF